MGHRESTPRAGEGLRAGVARLGRIACPPSDPFQIPEDELDVFECIAALPIGARSVRALSLSLSLSLSLTLALTLTLSPNPSPNP